MIEPSPLQTDTSLYRIRDERRARFLALRTEAIEHDVERQLLALDGEIIGTTPEELRALREEVARTTMRTARSRLVSLR